MCRKYKKIAPILRGNNYVISTKSDFFKSINRNIDFYNQENQLCNKIYKNKHESPEYKSRAQIILFYNGTIAITIPNQLQKTGGFKKLRLALLIPIHSNPLFARISKIRKDKRLTAHLKKFDANVEIIKDLPSDNLNKPIISYNHPKKGIEFIYQDCETDLFDLLYPFSIFRFKAELPDKKLTTELSKCLKTSTIKFISILKQMVVPLKDLYDSGFLHGDIKAENYLIIKDQHDQPKLLLSDFDFLFKEQPDSTEPSTLGGTLKYHKPTLGKKNSESELYSLSMSFKSIVEDSNLITSVWDAFYFLKVLAQKNKDPILEKLTIICCMIDILVNKMRKGRDSIYPSYDEILYDINQMEEYLLK